MIGLVVLFTLFLLVLSRRRRDKPLEYIVSFTTIPSRTKNLDKIVKCMNDQTIPPKYIVVNVPKRYERFEDVATFDHVPEGVIVNVTDVDYGPATKLMGLTTLKKNDFDVAFVVDDDTHKHPKWAETLLKKCKPNNMVSCLLPPRPYPPNKIWGLKENNVYGYTGFAIGRSLLRSIAPSLIEEWNMRKSNCFLVDDEFFTFFFNAKNIPINSCFYKNMNNINSGWLNGPDALQSQKGESSRALNQQSCKRNYCDTYKELC